MAEIVYRKGAELSKKAIRELYEDAGWTVFTDNLPRLMEAVARSLLVVTAWDKKKLVGLIRLVGDGTSIIYIQDILVLSSYRRKSIGTNLVKYACNEFGSVRQKVLLADDTPELRAFYGSLGFVSCDRGEIVAFARFD